MTIELSPKKCEMSSKRRGRENCLAYVSAVFFTGENSVLSEVQTGSVLLLLRLRSLRLFLSILKRMEEKWFLEFSAHVLHHQLC